MKEPRFLAEDRRKPAQQADDGNVTGLRHGSTLG
jgi:hypothetical protein